MYSFFCWLSQGWLSSRLEVEHTNCTGGGCRRGVMVKSMDCGIIVSEFELQSRYYVDFRANTLGKDMNPLILSAMGYIVPLLFFYENGFSIKKIDMPLNKETKPTVPLPRGKTPPMSALHITLNNMIASL